MKTIGIIPNSQKDQDLRCTALLIESITRRGGVYKLPGEFAKQLAQDDTGMDEDAVVENSDIIICLGGDGTFLKVARKAYARNIPILGVNLGRLGFLTEVEQCDIDGAVENVINGNYRIEERMMLEASIIGNDGSIKKDIALNDVVISRAALSRILHLKTHVDGVYFDVFPGDGLIVSTPTGSTGYSLSAGGPIVESDIRDLIIVTPICPHILYSRPFITSGDRTVKVNIDEDYYHDAMVTVDGQNGYPVRRGDSVEIRKAPCTVKMIRMYTKNFFNILRTKIYHGGEHKRDEI